MNDKQRIVSTYQASYKPIDQDKFFDGCIKYLLESTKDSKYIAFQSDFGFAMNDIPFTLILERNSNDNFNVIYWMNDWGTFQIETRFKHNLMKHWELHTDSDRKNIPDWKSHTFKSLIDKYGVMALSRSIETYVFTNVAYSELTTIFNKLFDEYDFDTINFNPGYIEGKIACLYKEAL